MTRDSATPKGPLARLRDRGLAGEGRSPAGRLAAALTALAELGIFTALAAHGPLLAGTVPLGVDVPDSDLDVICHAEDLEGFAVRVAEHYGHLTGFRVAVKLVLGEPSVVASFVYGGFAIEVFAQRRPVEEQRAYRHLVVEQRLLALGGPAALEGIRALRAQGLKTEPAFARYFGLLGEPYQALLDLYDLGEAALAEAVRR